jgi:hypothetical protein
MPVKGRCSLFALCLIFLLQACVGVYHTPKDLLALTDAQMKIRSFQTRAFDVKDRNKVLRSVVASLQDLGFIIERANGPLGLVTAGKFGPGGRGFVELTVTVRAKGEKQTEVRVSVVFNTKPIEDPKIYQDFFIAVERSLFVTRG